LLTGDAIVVAVHLSAWTVRKEELCFRAGVHLGATGPTVAAELHGYLWFRRRDYFR